MILYERHNPRTQRYRILQGRYNTTPRPSIRNRRRTSMMTDDPDEIIEDIEDYDENFPFWELCLIRHIQEIAE